MRCFSWARFSCNMSTPVLSDCKTMGVRWAMGCFRGARVLLCRKRRMGNFMTETTRLLRDLVALPSVNPMRAEIPADITLEYRVTAYLEQFFRSLGVPFARRPA